MPILPALEGAIYTLAPTAPRDPVVARIATELPFDEALSGAASSIAIGLSQGQDFDSADLTWACIRAGWPYPLSDMRSIAVEKDAQPHGLLAELALSPFSRIGLVRARGRDQDIWVLLQSEVRLEAAPFPKAFAIDAKIQPPFVAESGVATKLLSPSGALFDLAEDLRLDESGEWLLESYLGETVLLRAALFVEMETPKDALLPYQEPLSQEQDLSAEAATLLSEMHQDFFGTDKGLSREAALDTSARLAMKAWLNSEELPAAHVRFEKLGYVHEPRNELLCTGETIRACLDNLYWSIQLRQALLSEGHEVLGVAAEKTEDGEIMLMLNLAAN